MDEGKKKRETSKGVTATRQPKIKKEKDFKLF